MSTENVQEIQDSSEAQRSSEIQEIQENPTEEIVKEIDLTETDKDNIPDTPIEIKQKSISKLTEDERALIIKNHLEGIKNPYFDVKQFKNGNYRIIKKKPTNPSVSEKVIKTDQNGEKTPQKVYYSDYQLLFEHVIELNSKIDKLTAKHKKLKKKYQTLQNDVYVDDADEITEFNEKPTPPPPQIRSQQSSKKGWRNQISYL